MASSVEEQSHSGSDDSGSDGSRYTNTKNPNSKGDTSSEGDDDEDASSDSEDASYGQSPSKKRKRGKQGGTSKGKATAASRAKEAAIQVRKQARLAARRSGAIANPSTSRVFKLPTVSSSCDKEGRILNPYERARMILHVSATPEGLPCREEEFADIEAYLEDAIEEGSGTCIYIAGVPGTGKTATVHSVISTLKQRAKAGEIPPFSFVEINGMKVTEPNQAFVALWQFLSGGNKTSPRQALANLDEYFRTPDASRQTCVVLVDELDQLKTTKQEVIYNFFSWPNQPQSKLIVLAVANQMDMPEREFSNKVRSRLGHNRINFKAYTSEQLETILHSRLENIEGVFRRDAIRMTAKKVAAVVGDARKALDVCRRAVEVIENRNATLLASGGGDGEPLLVEVQDCIDVYKQMVSSGQSLVVKSMSIHQQLLLLAIAKVSKSLGVPEVEVGDVIRRHVQLCQMFSVTPTPTHDQLLLILSGLQDMRIVGVEGSRLDYYARVRSEVNEEDLHAVLKQDQRFANHLRL